MIFGFGLILPPCLLPALLIMAFGLYYESEYNPLMLSMAEIPAALGKFSSSRHFPSLLTLHPAEFAL